LQRGIQARRMYEQFCSTDAACPVNVDSKSSQRIKNAIETHTYAIDLFDVAQYQIFHLLRYDIWPRFIKWQHQQQQNCK
jgi:hypothetical protein